MQPPAVQAPDEARTGDRSSSKEALALHVRGMIEDGGALPDSSPLEAVMVDRENRDGVGILMPLKTEAIKAVGVNVTIPEDVLDRIDRYAADHGFNRSGCLTLAAKMAMETMEEMPDARNEPIAAPHRNTPGGHG